MINVFMASTNRRSTAAASEKTSAAQRVTAIVSQRTKVRRPTDKMAAKASVKKRSAASSAP